MKIIKAAARAVMTIIVIMIGSLAIPRNIVEISNFSEKLGIGSYVHCWTVHRIHRFLPRRQPMRLDELRQEEQGIAKSSFDI